MFKQSFVLIILLLVLLTACTPTTATDLGLTPTTFGLTATSAATPIIEPTTPTAESNASYETEPPSFQVQTITGEWVDGYFGWYSWHDVFLTTEYFEHKGPLQLNEDGLIVIDIASQRPLTAVSIQLVELEGEQNSKIEVANPEFPLTLEQQIDDALYELTIVGYWANGDEVASGFTVTTSSPADLEG